MVRVQQSPVKAHRDPAEAVRVRQSSSESNRTGQQPSELISGGRQSAVEIDSIWQKTVENGRDHR